MKLKLNCIYQNSRNTELEQILTLKTCWILSVFGNWESRSPFASDVGNMLCVISNTELNPAPWNSPSEQQLLVDSIFAELIKTHFRVDQIIFHLQWK